MQKSTARAGDGVGIEAIVGARSDKFYGPMLLVGASGITVELAKDAALRMLPVRKPTGR
jgi:acyl-CoA synthetase (NDP forming)